MSQEGAMLLPLTGPLLTVAGAARNRAAYFRIQAVYEFCPPIIHCESLRPATI